MAEQLPKYISPSRLARFYFHECPRYLRYSSVAATARAAEGIPKPPYDESPVTQAILEGGYLWEEEVVGRLLKGRVAVARAKDGAKLRDRQFTLEQTRAALAKLSPGQFLYQPTFQSPPSFYERYGLDPGLVVVPECRPDLITCVEHEGRWLLEVVDVKASPGVKLSHRIQATLYTLLLRELLLEWQLDDHEISAHAGIWLWQEPQYERFEVRGMQPPLETFLRQEVSPLMQMPADQAPWHVYFRCEWCPYFDHCREQMQETKSVSTLPYLSIHARSFLRQMTPSVNSLDELRAVLRDAGRAAQLDDCASLRSRRERLQQQLLALEKQEPRPYGGHSLAMPKAEHVRIVLTVQSEPVSGQAYAYGIYAQGLKGLLSDKPINMAAAAPDDRPETLTETRRALVRELHRVLRAVHEHNERHEDWIDKKSLQVYVFDEYERTLLYQVLAESVQDPMVGDPALQLFLYFQQPDVIEASKHPVDEVFFPCVALTPVLRELLALPAEVVYRLHDAAEWLRPMEYAFEYKGDRYLAFELSNQLRSDAIWAAWNKGKTENLERIERDLKARLWAANSVINGVRERLEPKGALFAWPQKFKLPATFDFQHEVLSKLAFVTTYESILGYLATRELRMGPRDEQIQSGQLLQLTYLGDDRFGVHPSQQDVLVDEDEFPKWLLAHDSTEGQRALLQYGDYANRQAFWAPRNLPLRLAGIRQVIGSTRSPTRELRLKLKEAKDTAPLRVRQQYLLAERFTDFNSAKVIEALKQADEPAESEFVRLISDPQAYAAPTKIAPAVRSKAIELARKFEMTPSQLQALERVLDCRLQLIWGPPGTGKTHALALTILCLLAAHQRAGKPLRVLVTAFTHAAIDNCLRKVARLERELRVVGRQLSIAKIGTTSLAEMDDVECVDKKEAGSWLSSVELPVLGGTVYSIHKAVRPGAAELVVIDEGSQLRVPESTIPVLRVVPGGRLVIAGDHRQLPPIVQGLYPDPETPQPPLHRSIFECLRAQDSDGQLTSTLLENWRMNEVLCRYPAAQIYQPEYRSANEQIAGRQLGLAGSPRGDLWDLLIDPDYPLVVCTLRNVRAAAENRVEADLVSRTAVRLRERLQDRKGRRYAATTAGDSAFWREGLFIVSPHHAQIAAIRRALSQLRDWQAAPFVGTVDKMQGQECDAVIVSYGVSDPEYALGEQEFIYSVNRLNVAITRARAKTIVFLPQPLVEPPIEAYEDPEVAEGVAFMQGLVWFAEERGEASEYELEAGAVLRVLRVAAQRS